VFIILTTYICFSNKESYFLDDWRMTLPSFHRVFTSHILLKGWFTKTKLDKYWRLDSCKSVFLKIHLLHSSARGCSMFPLIEKIFDSLKFGIPNLLVFSKAFLFCFYTLCDNIWWFFFCLVIDACYLGCMNKL
jgi:hypothetical protein